MASAEAQADELVAAAEKRMNSSGWFTSRESRLEDAAEGLEKACNQYKVAKAYGKAGETFRKLADVQVKLGDHYQAATSNTNAAKAFLQVNRDEAAQAWVAASAIFTDIGKFPNAAKIQKQLGEHYEEDGDSVKAIECYETAADYYAGENAVSQSNGCRVLAAALYATLEKYEKAIEIFEDVGQQSLDNNLSRFNAKDHFFKAGLCHFCTNDLVAAERAIAKYGDLDVSFGSQRENKLLEQILKAVQDYEVDDFTQAVAEYDNISKLDAWKTTILLRIKTALKSGQDDLL